MPSLLADIQYMGIAGCTQPCLEALSILIQSRVAISDARLLTSGQAHCFILTVDVGDLLALKSGFSSGYMGEGSRGLSRALSLLMEHEVEVREFDVPSAVIDRIDGSALKKKDLAALELAQPVRPTRWHSYIFEEDWVRRDTGKLWRGWCQPLIPYSIIDPRIFDLALSFWKDPDQSLMTGYPRLEDILRKRTGLYEHGSKLVSAAFTGNGKKLDWPGCHASEAIGRGQLFTGALMAFRNRRAHQELQLSESEALVEFLQLNHLFLLEHEPEEVLAAP